MKDQDQPVHRFSGLILVQGTEAELSIFGVWLEDAGRGGPHFKWLSKWISPVNAWNNRLNSLANNTSLFQPHYVFPV